MAKFINEWDTNQFEAHIHKFVGRAVKVENIEIAGYGNMNFTYRLTLGDQSTLIVKQSPPYCARFADIPAPEDRILSEFKYYELAASDRFLARHSPELLGLDAENKIAYISDLGVATDFSYLYEQKIKLPPETCKKLVQYLASLHKLEITPDVSFENLAMRKLNHEYIFHLPYLTDNEAINLDDITPGLSDVASAIMEDTALRAAAKQLGKLYFKNTRTLLHGDYYPMSWIETPSGLFVIDPEFGFLGLPEIDLGVFLAHMVMSDNFELAYKTINKIYGPYDSELAARFCAAEVIRRVTYVSQLPLINSLSFKEKLLTVSADVMKTGDMEIYENNFYNVI